MVLNTESLATCIVDTWRERCDPGAERSRLLVAIAGAPASGKSTLADLLVQRINERTNAVVDSPSAVLFGMDGYHLDNALLDAAGLRARKGAPDTFDVGGFLHTLQRLRECQERVAIPVFDRKADLARAAAAWIEPDTPIVVIEGNYLLLDRPHWCELAELFDITVGIVVEEAELRRRLIERWLDHGHDEQQAVQRAEQNDLINAKLVVRNSIAPHYQWMGP